VPRISDVQTCRDRLSSPADAAQLIPCGARIATALGAGAPPAILGAIADRARAGQLTDARIFYLLSTAIAGQSAFAPDLCESIRPMSFFHAGVERALDKARAAAARPAVDFLPAHFSQVPRALCEHIGVDTLIATVAPMDDNGNFSFGTNTDYAHAVAHHPGVRLLLEVNRFMPRVGGTSSVHVSQVAALVANDIPLIELPPSPRSGTDEAIGQIIAGLVEEGACLQMGIGALPDAVCAGLQHHRHLGIHTEMMTPGLAALIRLGIVDNSRKRLHQGVSVFTFAFGDRDLYDFLHDNPAIEAYPVEYVNDPAVIALNERMVSVNATLEIDLHGACNSEFVGGRQYSGAGGQVDFVRGAYGSPGGRSIIACHSTALGGSVSRIVPRLSGPVTTHRNDTHIVVTEHGWADLKGKSLEERARALIALADPRFREDLERDAYAPGLPERFDRSA
jgi:itaconate CoA-transferase